MLKTVLVFAVRYRDWYRYGIVAQGSGDGP